MISTSRSHRMGQFGSEPTLDEKIQIFQEQVLGWQIDVAEEMSRQFFAALSSNDDSRPMRHAGFAIVAIVFSYFETMAQYLRGSSSKGQAFDFFTHGFQSVYGDHAFDMEDAKAVYANIRCGMYHCGLTRPGVVLHEEQVPTVSVNLNGQLVLNPFSLVQDIKRHFLKYVEQLKDASQTQLRKNFEAVFDYGVTYTEVSMMMGSGSGW